MRLQAGVHLPDGPIRNHRLAALFVPFAIPLSNVIPAQVGGVGLQVLGRYLALVLIGLAIVTAVTGLVKGFPAWTLPTLGALLFVAWTALKWRAQPGILTALGQGSIYWPDALPDRLGIVARLNVASLAIALLMVLLVLLIFPGLWARSRRDWSLLSFMLYGLAIPYVFLYDAYRGLEPYEAVSALLLAAGAALFVLAPRRSQRLLGLAGALLLAQPVVSLGIYLIFPGQTFASPNQSHRLWETLQPVIELPVLLILVCLPALLSRLPAPGSRTPALKEPQPS